MINDKLNTDVYCLVNEKDVTYTKYTVQCTHYTQAQDCFSFRKHKGILNFGFLDLSKSMTITLVLVFRLINLEYRHPQPDLKVLE